MKSTETALAILIVFGIFVGIPALIGFAVAGTYILSDRRVRRAERAKAQEEAVSKVLHEQAVEAQGKAVAKEPTKETCIDGITLMTGDCLKMEVKTPFGRFS